MDVSIVNGSETGPFVAAYDLSATPCQPGFFCQYANSTIQTPCPKGTYNPLEGQVNCSKCQQGTYSGMEGRQLECDLCPKGSYTISAGSYQVEQCLRCMPGYHCPLFSQPVLCPRGTYNPYEAQVECIACAAGTYSDAVGRLTSCPPCPINSVCFTPSNITICPPHTTSAQGSTSFLDCDCLAGYECAYKREVVVSMNFNTTASDQDESLLLQLQNNTALIDALRDSVAKASGVSIFNVIFKGFRAHNKNIK